MTTRTEAGAEKSFASTLLPWIVAGLLTVVYLLTLNHWLSFKNLQAVARASGEIWAPDVYAPLFSLVITPFHWLPETAIPLAMNVFSMVCAFLVLVLLARCVALLPHDRTQKQREREHGHSALLSIPMAWVPVVLAVFVCGLQLTFWENATSFSSGMFDLLLFAYCVRCLLEYRVSHAESWLLRAAVVYAAAATESWVMVMLLPAFLVAIVWLKGLTFFQLRFLARLFLCVLAGSLFYLYLPLLHLKSDGYFWLSLKQNLSTEIFQASYIFRYTPHYVQLVMAMTSLLPILVIAIRWKPSFGDTSELGVALATWVFHLTHAALLGLCIWAAFDPAFSLRDAAGRFPILRGNRDAFLPFYFIAALSIGYFSGYFLLVFRPVMRRGRRVMESQNFLNAVSTAAVYALLILTPAGLLVKNIPQIKFTNGAMVKNYAAIMTEHLAPNGVIMSDNGGSLMLARSYLARNGKASDYLYLDTKALKSAGYYRFQTRQHPDLWPRLFTNVADNAMLSDFNLMHLVASLAETHPVYYLQPSFGYYFEVVYAVPHGLARELKVYPTNNVIWPPPLSEAVMAENETFWKEHAPELHELVPIINPPPPTGPPTLRQKWLHFMHIPVEKNFEANQVGAVYSRALNTWGVEAQRAGRLDAAGGHFEDAVRLFPENLVAKANADFNQKLRKGERVAVEDPSSFEKRFGNFDGWQIMLNADGIFDEPTGCLAQGIVFARGRLDREAAQNFERTLALAPESLLARLWLARVYVVLGTPEKAFHLVDELNSRTNMFADAAINAADVFQIQLAASYVEQDPEKVQRLVKSTVSGKSPDPSLLETAARVCGYYHDFTNALVVLDKQLQLSPNNVGILLNKAYAHMQLTNFNEAIPPLSRAISLAPTNGTALYFRAISYFETGKLDESQRDYEALQKGNEKAYPAYHGLGEIAVRKKDTNSAIRYFELDRTYAPPGSPEFEFATNRIHSLKTGAP